MAESLFILELRVFTHRRWMFPYYSVFRPDARGYMLLNNIYI